MQKSGWKNTVFVRSLEDIEKLKEPKGPLIQVWGSGKVVQLLLKNDQVDELCLKIYPVIPATGKRLFHDGAIPTACALTNSLATPTGAIYTDYERTGRTKTGNSEARGGQPADRSCHNSHRCR